MVLSELKLRNMEERDIDTIYKHIHQNYVNKYFKNEREQKELHNRQYESIISSKDYIFHIFENSSDEFIAMVRHKLDKDVSEVAIYLNRVFRERKYSKLILKRSIQEIKIKRKEIKIIEAHILEENIASQKLFSGLNFRYEGIKNYDALDYMLFRLILD